LIPFLAKNWKKVGSQKSMETRSPFVRIVVNQSPLVATEYGQTVSRTFACWFIPNIGGWVTHTHLQVQPLLERNVKGFWLSGEHFQNPLEDSHSDWDSSRLGRNSTLNCLKDRIATGLALINALLNRGAFFRIHMSCDRWDSQGHTMIFVWWVVGRPGLDPGTLGLKEGVRPAARAP
jgi:hypothetical protein